MKYMRYKKFYMNPENGQALGLIAREDTASYGRCYIVEVATPGMKAMLLPQKEEMEQKQWIEITREQFIELQSKYVAQFKATQEAARAGGPPKQGILSWAKRLISRK